MRESSEIQFSAMAEENLRSPEEEFKVEKFESGEEEFKEVVTEGEEEW